MAGGGGTVDGIGWLVGGCDMSIVICMNMLYVNGIIYVDIRLYIIIQIFLHK